jgi:probable F420-dependent oxidoreductase
MVTDLASETELRQRLGPYGAWVAAFDTISAEDMRRLATEIEAAGYRSIWLHEALGREVIAASALLLSATERVVVGTGIASIWARDAVAAANAQRTLSEAWPDRFVLGLGVSHAVVVDGIRGHRYERPLEAMGRYLDTVDSAPYMSPAPTSRLRVLAALRPGMLRLARERANGAHTYLVTPDHTHFARGVLGATPVLVTEQAVVLDDNPVSARVTARRHLAVYLQLPNYTGVWRNLGFTDNDFQDGGSDRLVDSLVAWGDLDTLAERIDAHRHEGADHVAIQILSAGTERLGHQHRQLIERLQQS